MIEIKFNSEDFVADSPFEKVLEICFMPECVNNHSSELNKYLTNSAKK